MSYPVQIDVVELGVDKLLHQFKDKVNIEDLLTTYLQQCQDNEDTNFLIAQSRDLNTAIGRALDQIGAYVGEARQGKLDNEYRDAIRLRIIVNNSNGTPNDVIQAANLILQDSVIYSEVYPAKIRLEVPNAAPSLSASNRIKRAVAAGVDLEVTYPAISEGTVYAPAASNINITLEANPTDYYA